MLSFVGRLGRWSVGIGVVTTAPVEILTRNNETILNRANETIIARTA